MSAQHIVGGPAHAALVKEAATAKKCAIRMLDEGSRDFVILREFIEQYIDFQSAADRLTGQTK